MNRTYAFAGVLLVFVVAVGIGAALYTGAGPAPGADSGDEIENFPTEEGADIEDSDGTATMEESHNEENTDTTGTDATQTAEPEPFSFTIDEIEECGTTCRDVTATLTNKQDDTASNVTVFTRIFAGENNTETDDIVWEGTEDVGTLEADEARTTTRRVELSLQEARQIDQEDGWITILTTVQSDDTTVTFRDSKRMT